MTRSIDGTTEAELKAMFPEEGSVVLPQAESPDDAELKALFPKEEGK